MLVQDRQGNTVTVYISHPIDGGVGHIYTGLCSWVCEVHGQVCSPFTPVSLDSVLSHAATNENLPDGAFAVLAPVLRGEDI
jgi:hypothetical protein